MIKIHKIWIADILYFLMSEYKLHTCLRVLTLSGLAFENYIKGWHGADYAPPMESAFQTVSLHQPWDIYRWVPCKSGSIQIQKRKFSDILKFWTWSFKFDVSDFYKGKTDTDHSILHQLLHIENDCDTQPWIYISLWSKLII